MKYSDLKTTMMNLFDDNKLSEKPDEWGVFNELETDVQIIAYATNITPEVISQASRNKADILITHHDSWGFVFGLKEKCNEMLIENNLIHAFFHAPLDDADFGTSASLAKALAMQNCKKSIPYVDIYYSGVIGYLEPPVSLAHFTEIVSKVLKEPIQAYENSDCLVRKVCIATGGGNMTSDMKIAVDAGCDTYITGEYALYSQQYAHLTGINLLIGSHTNTELPGVRSLVQKLITNTALKMIEISEPNY